MFWIWLIGAVVLWYPAVELCKHDLAKETTTPDDFEIAICYMIGTVIAVFWIPAGVIWGLFNLSKLLTKVVRRFMRVEKSEDI